MPLIRVTGISGSVPTTNQLGIGDIVINTYDGKAYIKKQVGTTQTVVPLGDGTAISASYALTASYAENAISASYFSGSISNAVSASYAATASYFSGSISNAISSSYALTSSYSLYAVDATNAEFSEYSLRTYVYGKNKTSSTILKGTPLYISASGVSGNVAGVYPADAGNPNRMPAGAIAGVDLNASGTAGDEGIIYLDGWINGVDTSAFTSGDLVYVSVGGGYTNVAPTGSGNLIQSLGYVEKVDASNGSGIINMSGETRSLPNLQESYIWIGNSDDVPIAVLTSSLHVGSSVSSSYALTASYAVSASYEINYETSSSYADYAVSSSHALTASYLEGYVDPFPYTGSALITGSLGITGSLSVFKSGSTVLNVEGSSGQLFSITDSLTGSLFSVNTVAGLPVMEAFSDNTVNIGKFGVYPIKVYATGTLAQITGSLFGTASYANQAKSSSYATNALLLNNTASSVFAVTGSNNFKGNQNISGSLDITGSLTLTGASVDVSLTATNILLNAVTLRAPQLPTSTPPGGATLNTVLIDQLNGTLYVTSSLPGTGGGGFGDRIVTGSITASVNTGPASSTNNFFLIQSGSTEMLKINAERVVVLEARYDVPTPITGGIYYSASGEFFFGI